MMEVGDGTRRSLCDPGRQLRRGHQDRTGIGRSVVQRSGVACRLPASLPTVRMTSAPPALERQPTAPHGAVPPQILGLVAGSNPRLQAPQEVSRLTEDCSRWFSSPARSGAQHPLTSDLQLRTCNSLREHRSRWVSPYRRQAGAQHPPTKPTCNSQLQLTAYPYRPSSFATTMLTKYSTKRIPPNTSGEIQSAPGVMMVRSRRWRRRR